MAKKSKDLKPYKSYRFTKQDPAVMEVLTHMAASGKKFAQVALASGVSATTFYNWRRRDEKMTRRPQNASIEAAGRAVGMKRVWVTNRGNH